MSRIAVCLFFIAIFQNGFLKSLADETAKTAEDEPAKDSEVPAKVEAEDKSGVTPKSETIEEQTKSDVSQKKDGNPNEGKDTTVNESKKEDTAEIPIGSDNRKFVPDILKGVTGNPVDQAKGLFEFPKHIFAPVNAVGAKVHEAVVKGLDTAKGLANGTFGFLSSAFNGPFQNK